MTVKHRVFRAKTRARWLLSRWPVAEVLNRSERTCWANCVSWAIDGGRDHRESIATGASCRAESVIHKDHACYCGKFTNGCLTRKGQTPGQIEEPDTTTPEVIARWVESHRHPPEEAS